MRILVIFFLNCSQFLMTLPYIELFFKTIHVIIKDKNKFELINNVNLIKILIFIGIDGAKRKILCSCLTLREDIKKRRLADIRKAHNADLQIGPYTTNQRLFFCFLGLLWRHDELHLKSENKRVVAILCSSLWDVSFPLLYAPARNSFPKPKKTKQKKETFNLPHTPI